MANEIIGYWTCPEGGKAEVTQTKKRGRHFNTRCDCCGFNQGTGAPRQQKIWDQAEFLPGVTVVRPSNVTETQAKPPVNEPEPETVPATVEQPALTELDDYDPDELSDPEPEPETEQAPPAAGSGLRKAAGVSLILGAVCALVFAA